MRKVLVIFFILLALVLVGEVGFLLLQKQKPVSQQKVISGVTPTSVVPHPLPTYTTLSPVSDPALDMESLNLYAALHKSVVYSSVITTEYRGTITELQYTPSYGFGVRLKASDGESNGFRINPDVLNKIGKSIKLDEIKIGDKISLTITSDLTKSIKAGGTLEVKIVKLP